MPNAAPSRLTIREAQTADSKRILQLCQQLGYTITHSQVVATIEQFKQDANQQVFVGCLHNEVMAWIHVFISLRIESEKFAEIGGLVVDQAVRTQGVGSQMVDHVCSWADKQGILKLRVRCADQRIDAHEFYLGQAMTKVKTQHVFDKQLRK